METRFVSTSPWLWLDPVSACRGSRYTPQWRPGLHRPVPRTGLSYCMPGIAVHPALETRFVSTSPWLWTQLLHAGDRRTPRNGDLRRQGTHRIGLVLWRILLKAYSPVNRIMAISGLDSHKSNMTQSAITHKSQHNQFEQNTEAQVFSHSIATYKQKDPKATGAS